MSDILAIDSWPTNGALIADVAHLYFSPDDIVLDATYGRGAFWTSYRPEHLVTNDLYNDKAEYHADFRDLHLHWSPGEFDVVVYDPPYKLNGTPALGDFDERYGIDVPMRWQDRMRLIVDGLFSCLRLKPSLLLVKCQDQVCSGQVRWQTMELTRVALGTGMRLVDRFDTLNRARPQPPGRRQVHARGRGSTLLVFGKETGAQTS